MECFTKKNIAIFVGVLIILLVVWIVSGKENFTGEKVYQKTNSDFPYNIVADNNGNLSTSKDGSFQYIYLVKEDGTLDPGEDGQVLVSRGPTSPPEWTTLP